MMRRTLLAAARSARQAAGASQGLAQLGGTSATAAGGDATAPLLLRRCSSAAARHSQHHTLLPPAAAAAAAAAATSTSGAAGPRAANVAIAALGRRGFAQMGTKAPKAGYRPPAEMQRAMQMRLSMVASNLLAEPYRGAPPPLPAAAYFRVAGWRELWRRFLSGWKSIYALSKCKKSIPGFDRKAFKGEALLLYRRVCALLAQGDRSELRGLVTPAVWTDMKRQLKQREDGGWARVQWDLAREPTADDLTTVHARLIVMDPKDDTTGFAQLTVRIPSQQRFAAYDKAGRLVAGDPEKALDVEDFWVFEHSLKRSPANRWRLAGRLSILPHAVEQRAAPGVAADAAEEQPVAEEQPIRMGHLQQQQRAQKPWAQQKREQKRAAAGTGNGRR